VKCIPNKNILIGFLKCIKILRNDKYIVNNCISKVKTNYKTNNVKSEEPRFTHAKISNEQNNVTILVINFLDINNNDNSNKCKCKSETEVEASCHLRSGSPAEDRDWIENCPRVRSENAKRKSVRNKAKIRSKSLIMSRIINCSENINYQRFNRVRMQILLSGDVETNPGPMPTISDHKTKLRVMTYNVQGLGNAAKLKRVNNILHKLESRDSYVINLQETHFKNEQSIAYHWKWGVSQSLGTSNSCGVAILYTKSYFDDLIESRKDKEGRYCSVTLSKDGEIYTFVNIYAPNNHYESLEFFKYVEKECDDIYQKHPLTNLIISGDFYFVISQYKDSIGRNKTQQEKNVVNKYSELAFKYSLIDTFRQLNGHGGYTWGKDNPTFLRSRLDYVYSNRNLANKLTSSYVTYTFNESDHNPVTSEFLIDSVKYGPGIIRGNSTLLEIPEIKEKIETELKTILDQIPKDWNPHQILDFYKYNLRILLLREGREKAKIDVNRLNLANIELGRLKKHLDKKLEERLNSEEANISLLSAEIDVIKEAIIISEESSKDLKELEAKKLIFRSRTKWAEQGEKSNRYFLNLVKERQRKMQVRKIISCGNTFYRQDEISKAISDFYSNLYKKQANIKQLDKDHPMFSSLPKLGNEDSNFLKSKLTLDELLITLGTCNESAPGPDGISYDTYKHLWSISGPIILNAWDHSNKIGVTSTSQRESIITLLEKKGKDRTRIENLRPISLSNCDIKLCTKALALRTSKIIHKLVDTNQTGYVPGRQVTDNIRLLEEIINNANIMNEKGFLITLDAQKAFDSIDHEYLIDLLKVYNFPDEYIRWIKVLYNNLNASVLVNGYTTIKFNIEQSVKQGDALSCVLFILAIEPLIKSLKDNNLIKPISVKCDHSQDTYEVQSATYADDITALVSDEESIQLVINQYELFSTFSGVRLNVGKTEILALGEREFKRRSFELITKGEKITIYNQEVVKVCGIALSNDNKSTYQENIINKIVKLERQLDLWRMRNLTLQGKILIVKTFGLSQLIYSLQSTYIREEELKVIENVIFRFVWNIKKTNPIVSGKIKRDIIKKDIEEGGLRAPDIAHINSSIKYKNLLKHLYGSNHLLKVIYRNKVGNKFSLNNYNIGATSKTYVGTALNTHKLIGQLLHSDIKTISDETDGIHRNYFAYLQNNELINSPFTNINQQAMITRLITYNLSINEIQT